MRKTYETVEVTVVLLTEDIITGSLDVSWGQDWNV